MPYFNHEGPILLGERSVNFYFVPFPYSFQHIKKEEIAGKESYRLRRYKIGGLWAVSKSIKEFRKHHTGP